MDVPKSKPKPKTPTLSSQKQTPSHIKEVTKEQEMAGSFEAKYEKYACHTAVTCKRNELQAAAEGQYNKYIAYSTGAKCEIAFGMEVCYGGISARSRGGTTVGHIFFTGEKTGNGVTADVIEHEKVHMRQWDKYGDTFNVLYWMEGVNPCRNGWEIQAGLDKGGYRGQCG